MWRYYQKNKENLELTKETYKDGVLSTEVFTKKNTPDNLPVDIEDFEIERITTNPRGGAWLKYKKKEELYENSQNQSLTEKNNVIIS